METEQVVEKMIKSTCVLLLAAMLLFAGCGAGQPVKEPEAEPLTHMTEASETEPQSVKEELAAIIEKEKDGLRKELEEDLLLDSNFQRKNKNPPENYEEYRDLMIEWENTMAKMTGDTEKDRELIEKANAIEKFVEELDPEGDCRLYDEAVHASARSFAMNSYYYTGETSPYKEGFVTDTDDFYPDSADGIVGMMCPQGMYVFALYETAATVRYVDEGVEIKDYSAEYTEEELENFFGGEPAISESHYMVFEVTECYYGDYEKGDLLVYRKPSNKDLCEEMKKGGEWFIFMGTDGEKFNVHYKDMEYRMHSSWTHGVFRVNEDGTVSSVSRYNDFRQYNGSTPKELALAMLRIRAKYRYMENEPA